MAELDLWYSLCGDYNQTQDAEKVTMMDLSSNLTCNLTEPPIPPIKGLNAFVLITYLGTFIFGACGNTLVIYIIGYFSRVRQKSVANYYIWNLAFADELFILALPFFCWASFTHNWPISGEFGNITCKVAYIARDMNKFTSIFTLCALSVDRALASCHYLGYLRTITLGKIVCVIIWLLSFVISTPYLIYARTVETKVGTSCRLDWPSSHYVQFWASFQFCVGLVIPSFFILTSYVILFRRLKRIAGRSDTLSMKRPSRRMTQTVLVIVISFVVCQIPYHVTQFIAAHRMYTVQRMARDKVKYAPSQSEIVTHVWLNAFSQVLVFISSCCNPIIYGLLNENFRRLYKLVLCRCHSEDRKPPKNLNMEIDESYSTTKFRFQLTFHLPCVGFKRLRQYHKQKKGKDLTEKIEMDVDVDMDCDTTQAINTAITATTPD